MARNDIEREWEDPALILDDEAPWRPWMRKGRLYRAINEGRYIQIAYQKKHGEEPTARFVWPKNIRQGKLWAEDLTPGHRPGFKQFIVERITFVKVLPPDWTPLQLSDRNGASVSAAPANRRSAPFATGAVQSSTPLENRARVVLWLLGVGLPLALVICLVRGC